MIPNRQWQYLIVDLSDCSVAGTDSAATAQEFTRSEDNIVIHVPSCTTLTPPVEELEGVDYVVTNDNIPEQQTYDLPEDN